MEIIILYETASSDGYTPTGDEIFYLNNLDAIAKSQIMHGAYTCSPIRHNAIKTDDGRYLLLKSTTPISIADSSQAKEDIVKHALQKLTDAERMTIGEIYPNLFIKP